MYDIHAAVTAGAAILDCAIPGWAAGIDIASLDLMTCTSCVLGQLHDGSYADGLRQLSDVEELSPRADLARDQWAYDHGFCLPLPDLAAGRFLAPGHGWDELRRLWAEEIAARTAA